MSVSTQRWMVCWRVFLAFLPWMAGLTQADVTSDTVTVTRGPYLQVGTPTSVVIRWRTSAPTSSVVFYGREPAFLYQLAGDLTETTDHSVTLTGLLPDSLYYYSVGTLFQALAEGDSFHFRTTPVSGTPRKTRIWAIGDSGTLGLDLKEHARQVRDAYNNYPGSGNTDIWLALGDNAYFAGEDSEYQTQFFNLYTNVLPNTILWTTIGNHETYAQSRPGGTFPYFDIFTLPTRGEAGGEPSGTENYYSFDYGTIHFVCLDSELSIFAPTREPMLKWLTADLASNTNQWLIAFWHSPPYSKGSHDSDEEYTLFWMRQYVVPILESYGVDLVLCGHSHNYERSFLLNGHYGDSSTLTPDMIVDVGSGNPEDTGAYYKPPTPSGTGRGAVYVVAGSSGWATYRLGVHPAIFLEELETGSMVIDVEGNHLEARFLRENGAIDDFFSVIKDSPPQDLKLVRAQMGDQGLTLGFKSVSGAHYQIEWTTDVASGLWQALSDELVGNGPTTLWLDAGAVGRREGFYRVTRLDADSQ